MPYLALLLEREVRSIMIKRTISGMIGAGSLAHNRRDFIAENVDPDRVHLNICYQNENLNANYVQTECQFRYCGTAIPFLTVRSTAR